jgi:8-oxo-dGTP diphosphatase
MIESTLGFLFTPDFKKVLLIRKERPLAHKGKYNGLGGKTEQDETALACIVREVEEEAGIKTEPSEWKKVGKLVWTEWTVEVFAGVCAMKNLDVPENVSWFLVDTLPKNIVTNLKWLIPYCIDQFDQPEDIFIDICYTNQL